MSDAHIDPFDLQGRPPRRPPGLPPVVPLSVALRVFLRGLASLPDDGSGGGRGSANARRLGRFLASDTAIGTALIPSLSVHIESAPTASRRAALLGVAHEALLALEEAESEAEAEAEAGATGGGDGDGSRARADPELVSLLGAAAVGGVESVRDAAAAAAAAAGDESDGSGPDDDGVEALERARAMAAAWGSLGAIGGAGIADAAWRALGESPGGERERAEDGGVAVPSRKGGVAGAEAPGMVEASSSSSSFSSSSPSDSSASSSSSLKEEDCFVGSSKDCVVSLLPHDVLLLLLTFVPPMDLLRSSALTSRRFAEAVRDEQLWRWQLREFAPGDGGPGSDSCVAVPAHLTPHQVKLCCLFSNARRISAALKGGRGDEPHLRPVSVLPSRDFAHAYEGGGAAGGRRLRAAVDRVCLATTTDRENERLENALPPPGPAAEARWDVILSPPRLPERPSLPVWQEGTYWSSAAAGVGGPSETDEVLILATKCGLALISDVAIKPFRELSGNGPSEDRVYSWPSIMVQVYHLPLGARALCDPHPPSPSSGFPCLVSSRTVLSNGSGGGRATWAGAALAQDANAPQREVIHSILRHHEPVYESCVHTVPDPNSDAWQHYPLPSLVVGNIVALTLMGKNHEQFPNFGFYVCVDEVAARGVPLYEDRRQAELMGPRFRRL